MIFQNSDSNRRSRRKVIETRAIVSVHQPSIQLLFLLRGNNDTHLLAFQFRQCFGGTDILQLFHKFEQEQLSPILKHDASSPKLNISPHFCTFAQKITSVFYLEIKVMVIGIRSESDLLDNSFYCLCLELSFLLLFIVKKLLEVNNFHNRRSSIGGYFHQIQTGLSGPV